MGDAQRYSDAAQKWTGQLGRVFVGAHDDEKPEIDENTLDASAGLTGAENQLAIVNASRQIEAGADRGVNVTALGNVKIQAEQERESKKQQARDWATLYQLELQERLDSLYFRLDQIEQQIEDAERDIEQIDERLAAQAKLRKLRDNGKFDPDDAGHIALLQQAGIESIDELDEAHDRDTAARKQRSADLEGFKRDRTEVKDDIEATEKEQAQFDAVKDNPEELQKFIADRTGQSTAMSALNKRTLEESSQDAETVWVTDGIDRDGDGKVEGPSITTLAGLDFDDDLDGTAQPSSQSVDGTAIETDVQLKVDFAKVASGEQTTPEMNPAQPEQTHPASLPGMNV